MTRVLTVPAAVQAAQRNGAFPVHILEIEWHDGIRYYSDGTSATPVPCEPRVKDWGALSIEATPENLGGYGNLTIALFDTDYALQTLAASAPGLPGAKATLYLWFEGTDWSDRVTLFGGKAIQPSNWQYKDGAWNLTLAGFEKQYKQHLGRTITRAIFPDVICDNCDGKLIPIVFGDPCLRVPCYVVNRPGHGWLRYPLDLFDDYAYLQPPPVNPDPTQTDPVYDPYGFTYDTLISIDVGVPGNYETITGCFCNTADRTQFTITSRGAFQAAGTSPGVLGADGHYYFLINQSDISSPGFSRDGYFLYLHIGGSWTGFVMDNWYPTGTSIAVLDVTSIYSSLGASVQWKISSQPSGHIPYWPTGSEMYEHGGWKYVLNFLPSQGVDRLEATAQVQPPNGGQPVPTWYTYGSDYYSINLDDRSYNAALGRSSGDPGLTTATLSASPAMLGFNDETVYATIRGITTNLFGGDTLANPALIINKLLTHPLLGGVPVDQVDSYSISSAAAATDFMRMAFAITTPQQLYDICSQIAFQAGMLHFWDQGRACLAGVTPLPDITKSVLTLDENNIQLGSLKIEDPATSELITELSGTYTLTCAASEAKIVRQAPAEVAKYGHQRKEVSFWAYQNNRFVALMTEFWLAALCSMQRRVTVSTYLNALHVQPGDVVTLNIKDGNGSSVLDNVPARIEKATHKFLNTNQGTMETIELEAIVRLWEVDIDVAAVDLDACNPPVGDVQSILALNGADRGLQTVMNNGGTTEGTAGFGPGGPATSTTSSTSTAAPCPCGAAFASLLVVSGMTGACATFNGTFVLTAGADNCTFTSAGTGGAWLVKFASGVWTVSINLSGCTTSGSAAGTCSISATGTLTVGLDNGGMAVIS